MLGFFGQLCGPNFTPLLTTCPLIKYILFVWPNIDFLMTTYLPIISSPRSYTVPPKHFVGYETMQASLDRIIGFLMISNLTQKTFLIKMTWTLEEMRYWRWWLKTMPQQCKTFNQVVALKRGSAFEPLYFNFHTLQFPYTLISQIWWLLDIYKDLKATAQQCNTFNQVVALKKALLLKPYAIT